MGRDNKPEGEGSNQEPRQVKEITQHPENIHVVEEGTEEGYLDMQEEDGKDMEFSDLDLEGLEKSCDDLKEGYIPSQQVMLLHESIINSKMIKTLGVMTANKKESEGMPVVLAYCGICKKLD